MYFIYTVEQNQKFLQLKVMNSSPLMNELQNIYNVKMNYANLQEQVPEVEQNSH